MVVCVAKVGWGTWSMVRRLLCPGLRRKWEARFNCQTLASFALTCWDAMGIRARAGEDVDAKDLRAKSEASHAVHIPPCMFLDCGYRSKPHVWNLRLSFSRHAL